MHDLLEIEADLRGIRQALERIAAALDLVVMPPTDAALAPPPCQHPPDRRVDFGVTNGVEDFQCTACGFRPEIPAVPSAEVIGG